MTAAFIPSLKHMVLAMTAVRICSHPNIRHFINGLNYLFDKFAGEEKWNELLEMADNILSELQLPPLLHHTVQAVIKPIALEIARWKTDHLKVLCNDFDYEGCELHWKAEGIIDRQKTAEKLMLNENVCKLNRFYFACFCCNRNKATEILSSMSEKEKNLIVDGRFPFIIRFMYINTDSKDDINWCTLASQILNELYPSTICNYQDNPIWLRFFSDHLTAKEKRECIEYIVKNTFKDHDNFRFSISQLGDNERESVFSEVPSRLLRFLLDWPYQSLFSEAAEQMWKYLQVREFRNLLHFIIYNRIAAEWHDFDYVNLLKDFWFQSPKHFKDDVKNDSLFEPVETIINHNLLHPFPKEEIIKSFLRIQPPEDKKSLLRDGDFFGSYYR